MFLCDGPAYRGVRSAPLKGARGSVATCRVPCPASCCWSVSRVAVPKRLRVLPRPDEERRVPLFGLATDAGSPCFGSIFWRSAETRGAPGFPGAPRARAGPPSRRKLIPLGNRLFKEPPRPPRGKSSPQECFLPSCSQASQRKKHKILRKTGDPSTSPRSARVFRCTRNPLLAGGKPLESGWERTGDPQPRA